MGPGFESLRGHRRGKYTLSNAVQKRIWHNKLNPLFSKHPTSSDYKEPFFEKYGIYTRESFLSFAAQIDIPIKLAENILNEMTGKENAVKEMVNRSFLSKESKSAYYHIFEDRQMRLNAQTLIPYAATFY